jgi:hypothetical protein
MTTATATLRYSSSREQDTRDAIARVSAAGRVEATRRIHEAREAARLVRATQVAVVWVESLRSAGAVEVGFKHCTDLGKHRFRASLADAVGYLARHGSEDIEAWGLDASNEFVGEGW